MDDDDEPVPWWTGRFVPALVAPWCGATDAAVTASHAWRDPWFGTVAPPRRRRTAQR